jgi:hypothetical protein
MPKLYEYFGLLVMFYANEHEPIHVHGKYDNRECKAELIVIEGQIVEIRFVDVKGRAPLEKTELKKFKLLVEVYKEDIVQKWIDFFILHKTFDAITITKKLD